ncbi:NERD domain-containing protein [Candidatus Saccharibacteria bacterium]|nr:NERD domain-containing protein [Candidatus Saccharibacteria bacterium]
MFFYHDFDKNIDPEEWKDAGRSGERILYKTLHRRYGIPEEQIFRNVYVPNKKGQDAEIDLLVVSRKGIFVFECKNYGGNIYGDAKRRKWVQYIGRKKSYFYSPLLQNKNHAKYLKIFLARDKIEVPIIPLVSTITRGNWKVRNLKKSDYVLGLNCHFRDIYEKLSDSEAVARNYKKIMAKLAPLSRVGEEDIIRQKKRPSQCCFIYFFYYFFIV